MFGGCGVGDGDDGSDDSDVDDEAEGVDGDGEDVTDDEGGPSCSKMARKGW